MLNFDNETQVITMIAKDTGDFVFKLDNVSANSVS